jgi:hypothetical protein
VGRRIAAPRQEQARADQRALTRVRIHALTGGCDLKGPACVNQAQPIVDAWRGVIRAFACHLGPPVGPLHSRLSDLHELRRWGDAKAPDGDDPRYLATGEHVV